MMKTNEYNLSVLENVTELVSPFKSGSDYEAVLGLIQGEIEMQTENETDLQKVANLLHSESEKEKFSDFYNDENLSKSPDSMKSFSRHKSRASLLRHHHEKNQNQLSDKLSSRKGRSLGAVKPRRSSNLGLRITNVSAGHSFKTVLNSQNVSVLGTHDITSEKRDVKENPIDNDFQGTQIIEDAPFVNTDSRHRSSSPTKTNGNENPSGVASESLKLTDSSQIEPIAFKPNESRSPGKSQDTDFVASSQSTTDSSLRQKLDNLRRSPDKQSMTINRKSDGNQQNGLAPSEDVDNNFASSFSSGLRSEMSSERKSVTPPIPRKRKVSPLEWYEIVSSKQQKIYSSDEEEHNLLQEPEDNFPQGQKIDSAKKSLPESSKTGQNSISLPSPLKGLSQELHHCIADCDYKQMSQDLDTEMLNVTNFSFETIELLNAYEESNEKTNNQILSRIFCTPPLEIKDEPLDHLDASALHEQPTDDPLHIEATLVSPPMKLNKRTSVVGKRSIRKSRRVSNKFLMKQIEENENAAASTSKTKRSASSKLIATNNTNAFEGIEKYLIRPRRSPRKSLSENITENGTIVSEKTKRDKNPLKRKSENTKKFKDIKEKSRGKENRRSSPRLKVETPSSLNSFKLEDVENLAVEAADISMKIEDAGNNSRLSEQTLNMLENLVIKLRHEILPQHNIERKATSKHLTSEERKEFMKFAQLNKDNYSAAEDETIRANWEAFCQDHDWEPTNWEPFIDFKHGDKFVMSLKERRKFVQFLADGLPNRSLYSVFGRFKRLFRKPPSTGSRYTKEEDTKILAYMLHAPSVSPEKKCFELSKILERKRQSIYTRFQKLKEKCFATKKSDVLDEVEWSLCLIEKYITTLLDVTVSEDLMELKDAFLPKVVWLKMEQKMKIRWQLLSRFWEQQLHLQLFATEPIHLNQIKTRLIEHIYSSKIAHPMDIKWNHVLRHFDGLTTYFLRKTFNHLTVQTSKTLRTRNFKRIMDWLHTVKTHQLMNSPREKCLPRILYRNQKAEFLAEDIEKIQSYSGNQGIV